MSNPMFSLFETDSCYFDQTDYQSFSPSANIRVPSTIGVIVDPTGPACGGTRNHHKDLSIYTKYKEVNTS